MANPMQYIQVNELSHYLIRPIMREFEDELKCMSGKCIDIGCGPGDVSRYTLLPALNPKAIIIGTDISEEMIKHAKKLNADEQRLKFDVLDIETKCLPEKYISAYDHVFMFHVMQWCSDGRQIIENTYRLLQPGGTMLMLTISFHDAFPILQKMSQDDQYKLYVTHKSKFVPPFFDSTQSCKELKESLKSVGFNVLHCSLRERSLSAKKTQELSALILSLVTQYFNNMPHDLMEQFKNEFIEEYGKTRFFHKQMRNQAKRIVSDLHDALVVYAQK